MLRTSWAFLLAGLMIAGPGCQEEPVGIPEKSAAELGTAPETLTVSNQRYILETYLWRDFQPISPPEGKPLIALIWVVEADSNPIPANITPEYIWLVYNDSVWAGTFSDEQRPATPDCRLERVARDGPLWGPNIAVDVVVGVSTGSEDLLLLRASDQMIHRTD
jgi:hypothetical protein